MIVITFEQNSSLCVALLCINVCNPTWTGVSLLSVDLQEDECREEQQPAAGLIRGLPHRGPPAPRCRVQDTAGAPDPGRRGKQRGRWGTGGRGEGAGRLQRLQGHRDRSAGGAGGGRHCGMLIKVFYIKSSGSSLSHLYFTLASLSHHLSVSISLVLTWQSLLFSFLSVNVLQVYLPQTFNLSYTVHQPLYSCLSLPTLF